MIVERIYLKDAEFNNDNVEYLMTMKVLNGYEASICESKNGIVVICNFEISRKGLNSIYRQIKKNTKATLVYAKYSELELFNEPIKKKVIKKEPDTAFNHPKTIWFIEGISHKKCSKCNDWLPVIDYSKAKTGLQGSCKKCQQLYKIKNYKKIKANNKNFRKNNPGYDKNYKKTYNYNPNREVVDNLKENNL